MESLWWFRVCLAAFCAVAVYAQDPTVEIRQTEPATMEKPRKIVVLRDSFVTMSCYVENLPMDKRVRWQLSYVDKDGITHTQKVSEDTAIEDNTRFSIEKPTDYTWRLRIKAIQATDEGTYTCFVQTTRDNKKVDSRFVEVRVPPTLNPEQTSPDTKLREGDSIDLMCNATGNPTPTIEWTRVGGAVLPVGEEKFMGSVMKITNVNADDRGTYKCKAYNSVGTITRKIQLEVRFKPIIKIERGRDDLVFQAVGYRTDLQCIAEANPFPRTDDVKWMKDGVSITSTIGRMEVQIIKGAFGRLTYELIIHGVEREDYGVYKCMISNSEGDAVQDIRLSETETPQASVKLGRIMTGAESRQVGAASQLYVSLATAFMCVFTALLHHL